MTEQGNDPRNLRVSNAEREHLVSLLQEAMTRGLLDVHEFDERSERALKARTRGDLDELTADLPMDPVPYSGSAPSSVVPQNEVVELTGTFSSLKRKGVWTVPRKLVLRRRMGSTELDFTEAHIGHAVVDIELDIVGGSVEMRLPEGSSASTDGIEVSLGSVEDHRRGAKPAGTPHFAIVGSVRWGSVEIRGPRRSLFNRR
jgi:hypothetical protein